MEFETTIMTQEAIENTVTAADTYKNAVSTQFGELKKVMDALLTEEVFYGDAADGYKAFYLTNVKPLLETTLPKIVEGVKSVVSAEKETMIIQADPALKNFNENPGGEVQES